MTDTLQSELDRVDAEIAAIETNAREVRNAKAVALESIPEHLREAGWKVLEDATTTDVDALRATLTRYGLARRPSGGQIPQRYDGSDEEQRVLALARRYSDAAQGKGEQYLTRHTRPDPKVAPPTMTRAQAAALAKRKSDEIRQAMQPAGAAVLGTDANGNPIYRRLQHNPEDVR